MKGSFELEIALNSKGIISTSWNQSRFFSNPISNLFVEYEGNIEYVQVEVILKKAFIDGL